MSGTLRVFLSELLRLARSRWAWAGLLLVGALAGLRAYTTVATQALDSEGESPITSGAAWAPFVDGWRVGLVLGGLLLLGHAARSIAGDRETGVLRLALTRSVSRPALVFGRLLLAPVLVTLVAGVTAACAAGAAMAQGDFGPLVEDGYELWTSEELSEELWLSARAVLLALLPLYAFGLLISSLARGATSAVATALGSFLAFDLFKESFGDGQAFVFAYYTPSLADTSALAEMAKFARGFSDALYSPMLVRLSWTIPLPEMALFALLAAWVLSRRAL